MYRDKGPVEPSGVVFYSRVALIFILVLVVYTPAISNGFIWDDDVMLTDNVVMKADDGLRRIWFTTELSDYFPLTSTTFWIEWRIWGLNPIGYNVTNILLHALSGVLLWRVLLRLKVPGAWLAGILFTVHPVCVASVDWIAERKNTLSMVFYLAALIFYLRFELDLRKRTYAFALLAFVLALLSKTSVVVFPVVVLLCAWWQRSTISKQDIVRSLPFFMAAMVFGLVTVWFQLHELLSGELRSTDTLLTRLLGGSWAIWFYLGKALWPVKLCMIYPQWRIIETRVLSYVPALLWLATLVTCWVFRRRWGRPFFFGLAYFTIALLPVLGFLHMDFLRFSQAADHLQYIALPGITALTVAIGVAGWKRFCRSDAAKWPGATAFIAACPVLLFSVLTWQQSSTYVDEETLWRDTIRKNPTGWVGYHNLADRLAELHRFDEATHYYQQALELEPDYAKGHNNLGNCLVVLGRIDEAIDEFLDAIQTKPELAEAHHNLGVAFYQQKEYAKALECFKKASALQPEYASAYFYAGNTELQLGYLNEALNDYFKAAKYNPDEPDIHYNIGITLGVRGNTNAAVRFLRNAIRLQPNHLLARKELDLLLTSTDPQH